MAPDAKKKRVYTADARKYAMLLSYRGTNFCGWQKQLGPDSGSTPSIGETLEKAIEQVTSEDVSVVGSGRTDSGVHAVGQVAHFILQKKEWDPSVLFRALNSYNTLSGHIRILALDRVTMEFHAQRSALKKQYSYYFQQGPTALPHLEPYSWWIRKKLDLDAMNEALSYLQGEHDFKPFQARGAKPVPSTVRKILEAEAVLEPVVFPGGESERMSLMRMRLVGTGFLKQMVRGIAGTLLAVGEGRRKPESVREILEKGERKLVSPTAPAKGLWLERVWYDQKVVPPFGRCAALNGFTSLT